MNEIIQKPWDAIQKVLRSMDSESPRGLRDWKSHPHWNGKKDEPPITIDLAQRLFDVGIPAFAEVVYPNRKPGEEVQHCDVVVDLGATQYMWIEAKLLWTVWWTEDGERRDSSGSNAKRRIEDFLCDCKKKLFRLNRPYATFIGGLAIAFETPPKEVRTNLIEKVTSELSDWQIGQNSGNAISSKTIHDVECINRIWFWYRKVVND